MKSAKRRRTSLIAAASAVLISGGIGLMTVGGADADEPQSACETTGVYEVCTSHPQNYPAGDPTIIKKIREYVQGTVKGDVAHVAMYQWQLDIKNGEGLVRDLADAQDRGVSVNIITANPKGLNDDTLALMDDLGLEHQLCERGCLPNPDGDLKGVMHMKFFTFKHGDDVQVVHTSSNFSRGQLKRHQNMLSIKDDRALYDSYVGYFNRMSENSWTYDGETWDDAGRTRWGDDQVNRVWFTPREADDPIRDTLEDLTCDGDNNRVWVNASVFNRTHVLMALDDLDVAGCDVRVIVSVQEELDWAKKNSGLDQVRMLGTNDDFYSQHNKLLITDADYQGTPRTAVYAGSHNLDTTALRNTSDSALEVDDQKVFDIYAGYYEEMWDMATE